MIRRALCRLNYWFNCTTCYLGWHRHGVVYSPITNEHNCLSCGRTWFPRAANEAETSFLRKIDQMAADMNHCDAFNGLSDGEAERLAILAEECGEVVQVVGKILRHGYTSYHPKDEHHTANRRLLEKELGDILWVLELMVLKQDIDGTAVATCTEEKRERHNNYLHHQVSPQVVHTNE